MLKIITSLVCTFIMINVFNQSFTTDCEQLDLSLPILFNAEEVVSSVPGRANERFQPDWVTNKVFLTKMMGLPNNYRADSFSKLWYKPVQDEYPYLDNSGNLRDNTLYKEWCEETFDGGLYIYDAYRDIAFNIEYTPEQAKTDIWKTPFETNRSQKGDCEDAVFLFSSHLPSKQENAMIIWGWVIDKSTRVAKAHVWHQLIDKTGQQYIVEGFSNDWSGIIPIEVAGRVELRKPIFTMTHAEVCQLACLASKPDSWQTYQSLIDFCLSANFIDFYTKNINVSQEIDYMLNTYYGFIGHLLKIQDRSFRDKGTISNRSLAGYNIYPAMGKEVTNIFTHLYELFIKCNRQKKEFCQNTQIAYRSLVNTTTN